MLNRVILIGRLTRDPEMKVTPAGVQVTQFTLAIDRPYTSSHGEKEADFVPVVAWRQLAELSANFLRKGRLAAVEGRLQIRHYDNNEGKRVYVTEVVADNVRFLESNRDQSQRTDESSSSNRSGSSTSYGYPPETQTNNSYAGSKNSTGSYKGNSGRMNGNGQREERDPFAMDGNSIDISDDDLPF